MVDMLGDGWSIVGVGDFNGDGLSDLLLRNVDGTVVDWLSQNDGSFVDNGPNWLANPGSGWNAAAIGDANGDQRGDILWRNNDGTVVDWLGQSSATFADNGSNFLANLGTAWQIAGTGDFNGDGRSDILWRNADGTIQDWLGQQNGGFADNGVASTANPGSSWSIAGLGDFNGDGRTDILWQHSNDTLVDWLGQANGGFADNGANFIVTAASGWHVSGIGDFNGDHHADILWRNTDGTITDWLGQANGGFVDNSAIASQPVSLDLQIAGVGDFNGDGRSDVLFRGADGTLETWVGAADGSILSPMEKLWQDALANVSAFFDEMANSLESYSPQSSFSDQNSYSVYNPMEDVFHGMLSWTPVVQAHPASPIADILALNLNPNFQVMSITERALAATFNMNFGSMNLLDSMANKYTFNMNGVALQGTWHEGTPPSGIWNPIYVIAPRAPAATGYFVFDPAASGFNFSDGHGGDPAGVNISALNSTGEAVAPFLHQPHMAPGTVRGLTLAEKIALAGYTNLTDEQLDAIRIYAGGQFGDGTPWGSGVVATTYSSEILKFNTTFALTDFSNDPDTLDALVHELYHAYQYTTIGAYRVIGDQASRVFGGDIYTYTQQDIQSSIQTFGSSFANLNVEAQAQIAEDFFRIEHGLLPLGAVGFTPTTEDLNSGLHFRLPR